jgi:enhanced filamentous growth protein 1
VASASLDEKVIYFPNYAEITWVDPFTDNHMINGTKLLNVAGMTRGRRDGILKSEKVRHVVKIGPMHLKGVWYVATLCGSFRRSAET